LVLAEETQTVRMKEEEVSQVIEDFSQQFSGVVETRTEETKEEMSQITEDFSEDEPSQSLLGKERQKMLVQNQCWDPALQSRILLIRKNFVTCIRIKDNIPDAVLILACLS
jgi:hypothetical protein